MKKETRDWRKETLNRFLRADLEAQEKLQERIEKVRKILDLRTKNKESLQKIGKKFGVSRQAIHQIIKQFKLD